MLVVDRFRAALRERALLRGHHNRVAALVVKRLLLFGKLGARDVQNSLLDCPVDDGPVVPADVRNKVAAVGQDGVEQGERWACTPPPLPR